MTALVLALGFASAPAVRANPGTRVAEAGAHPTATRERSPVLRFRPRQIARRLTTRALRPGDPFRGHAAPPRIATSRGLRLLWQHREDPLGLLTSIADEYGFSAHARLPTGEPMLFLSDPESIQAVLKDTDPRRGEGAFEKSAFTSDPIAPLVGRRNVFTGTGRAWRAQRMRLNPHFQPRAIDHGLIAREMESLVTARVAELSRQAANAPGGALRVDLADELTELTLEVMLHTLFHPTDLTRAELVPVREALQEILGSLTREEVNPTRLALHQLPRVTARQRRLARAYGVMESLVARIVTARAGRDALDPPDVLDTLLDTPTEDGRTLREIARTGEIPTELRDEVLTMVLAGHETTASSLGWAFYDLTRAPAANARVMDELVRPSEGPLAAGIFRGSFPFLNQVWRESLRLHSPVYVIVRKATRDIELPTVDGAKQFVPAGSQVVMSPHVSQRREDLWGKGRTGFAADAFHPERFDPEAIAAREVQQKDVRLTPFGHGPRNCLGQHFATLEGQMILGAFLKSFQIRPVDPHAVARAGSNLSGRIADGLAVDLLPR